MNTRCSESHCSFIVRSSLHCRDYPVLNLMKSKDEGDGRLTPIAHNLTERSTGEYEVVLALFTSHGYGL